MAAGETIKWEKATFLAKLKDTGIVAEACKGCGINRSTAYRAREADPEFAAAWDEIHEAKIDELESVGLTRAIDGSDRLIEFFLRAQRPDTYRERLSIEDERKREQRQQVRKLTDAELDEKLAGVDDHDVIPIEEAPSRRRRRG
jgi:hypothetical protein